MYRFTALISWERSQQLVTGQKFTGAMNDAAYLFFCLTKDRCVTILNQLRPFAKMLKQMLELKIYKMVFNS